MTPFFEIVAHDLRVFADPATPYGIVDGADCRVINMIRNGQERVYSIRSNRTVSARHEKREYSSIVSLLASADFADVRTLRATQRRLLETRRHARFMPSEGTIEGSSGVVTLSEERFRTFAQYRESGSLQVLLVDGPAGIGKTSLIERLVHWRSEPSSDQPPLLHVTSSGKRLTSLIQELAHATQLLRAQVTFDQVPVLARWGVIQVAIDGFDELVDDAGYRDAWSALREFLGQVGTGGPIILAGRDTFFDQQDFRTRLGGRIANLELTTARLQPVSKATAREFLLGEGWSEEDLQSADSRDWFQPGSYQLRPFFLAQIASAGAWGDLKAAHGSPQAFIVTRFVRREAELVSRMVGIPVEEAESALWEFYGVIVEDMAIQESDAVDVGYLALACESSFSGRLSSTDLQKLVHKAGSLGLLEADRGDLRRFPHSEIQAQFLARALLRSILDAGSGLSYLRRVGVAMPVAEAFADTLVSCTDEDARNLIGRLVALHRDEPLASRLVSNSISLLFACLTRPNLQVGVDVEGGGVSSVRVFGVLEPATFRGITVTNFDARGADLRAISFQECTVLTLTADDNTRFGVAPPRIVAIVLVSEVGGVQAIRDVNEVDKWVAEHATSQSDGAGAPPSELPLVRYFDRVCRKFMRQRQIRNGANDEAYFLIQDPMWEEIRPLLSTRLSFVEAGKGRREASGPNDGFLRLRSPERLLNPPTTDPESCSIREKVIHRARELEVGSAVGVIDEMNHL